MAKKERLSKKLTLFDVYAVSTGAMFSSGFFLLPGIAAMETGNSVYLSYLVAGFLILPSMLTVAELATAMPRAGGAYYFLDRSLGPLVGTIGGLGSWIALIFKSAFALIGMGAYLSLYIDLPMLPLALVLTVVFGLLNIFGAKETAFLQRLLVSALVLIMGYFLIEGVEYLTGNAVLPEMQESNFLTNGMNGFISTVGLVFVSYAGLTKVASIAEEVQNPDKAIPLGMTLSLLTASIVYVLGVFIMVKVLPAATLFSSLTPVTDAGYVVITWIPESIGILLIVIAAIAAFASTGNAGIMSASRYPLAMSRDGLMPQFFGKIGRFKTPHISVLSTTFVMILVLLLFDVEAVAKLASAFQLLLFFLLNLAVVVMRESKIEAYKPGFNSPFYPWVQILGMIISLWLVAEMGLLAVGLTGTLIILCIAWYFYYAHGKVKRQGAIYHVHARLGQMRYEALEHELMTIINEKNLDSSMTYEEVIARSEIIRAQSADKDLDILSNKAVKSLEQRLQKETNLESGWATALTDMATQATRLKQGVYFKYVQLEGLRMPEMVAIQCKGGLTMPAFGEEKIHALIFLVTPEEQPLLHMRIIGHMAELIEAEEFLDRWIAATDERTLKEVLLSDERLVHVRLQQHTPSEAWIDKEIMEIELPGECLVTIIERNNEIIIPKGRTKLHSGDVLSILGYPKDIQELRQWLGK
ncbi:MAG: amino acid permease [Bacteroidetes bacterium]|jgi:amino acid transporter|nr:amino acid permease [Balneolaceae bacterium]MDA0736622.1 amino acid permease [Bacteroidota bacterium]